MSYAQWLVNNYPGSRVWHCVAVRGHDAMVMGAPSCELCLTHPHIILHAFYSFAVFGGSEDAARGMAAL